MVLILILLLVLLAGGGYYGHGAGWYAANAPYAYGGTGLLGTLLVILLVLVLLGRI